MPLFRSCFFPLLPFLSCTIGIILLGVLFLRTISITRLNLYSSMSRVPLIILYSLSPRYNSSLSPLYPLWLSPPYPCVSVLRTFQVSVLRTPQVSVLRTPRISILRAPQVSVLRTRRISILRTPQVSILRHPRVSILRTHQVSILRHPRVSIPRTTWVSVLGASRVSVLTVHRVSVLSTWAPAITPCVSVLILRVSIVTPEYRITHLALSVDGLSTAASPSWRRAAATTTDTSSTATPANQHKRNRSKWKDPLSYLVPIFSLSDSIDWCYETIVLQRKYVYLPAQIISLYQRHRINN